MAKEKTKDTTAAAPEPDPEFEDRIEEFAIGQFEAMGYEGRLSPQMVALYKEFKKKKDRMHPGRLEPEGFAFVATLADVVGGKLVLPEA